MIKIDSGVTRVVYLSKRYAFKLPRIRCGRMRFIQGYFLILVKRNVGIRIILSVAGNTYVLFIIHLAAFAM